MPALRPTLASVSLLISSRILLKSKNFWPGMCRNSPHSSVLAALSVVLVISFSTPFACDGRLMSWRTSGRRVTMPEPRGRLRVEGAWLVGEAGTHVGQRRGQKGEERRRTHKSRPTMFSNTELFPLDWLPTTTIWGRSMGLLTPTVVKTSWSLLTSLCGAHVSA